MTPLNFCFSSLLVSLTFTVSLKAQEAYNFTDISNYPLLKSGITYGMESSYDRTGGNDDGFEWIYSILRREQGKSVIFEKKGAGMVSRIWFPYDADFPDVPMFLRGKRIYIYIDDMGTPIVNMPVLNLFNNTDRNFPFPLCGMALGGCWCHVPFVYHRGIKIAVEGDSVAFFQIQYQQYAKVMPALESYSGKSLAAGNNKVMDVLWNSGDVHYLNIANAINRKTNYILKRGENELSLLDGPAILRALIVKVFPPKA